MKFADLMDGENFWLSFQSDVIFCKIPRLSVKVGKARFSLNCLRLDGNPDKVFLEILFVSDDENVCLSES